MKNICVIAPHPDDETLGCGGTLFKHKAQGDFLHWIIMTGMTEGASFSQENIKRRQNEIDQVKRTYGFSTVHALNFPATQLDQLPLSQLIQTISGVFQQIKPEVLYFPFAHDAHSDHRVTFDAASACTKWFRHPYLKRVLSYETISETEFSTDTKFSPNYFIDITGFLDNKLDAMRIYESELGVFPFPRCEEVIRSLALLRGSTSGYMAAEAFELLLERHGTV